MYPQYVLVPKEKQLISGLHELYTSVESKSPCYYLNLLLSVIDYENQRKGIISVKICQLS